MDVLSAYDMHRSIDLISESSTSSHALNLRVYCDVDGDMSYSTRSSRRAQQASVDFVSAIVGKRGMLPQKLLMYVVQFSPRPLREPEDGSCK